MAAKRFFNIFKSSQNKRDNKENNDLLLGSEQERKPALRRVNFQTSVGNRLRSYLTEIDDDDGSEVTLTATEASRSKQMPPNPYSVVTEPKRNRGPRSCPGGGGGGGTGPAHLFDFDSLENGSSVHHHAPDGADHDPLLDRSLEARSEFLPAQHQNHRQHRRSSRRRVVGGGNGAIGGGGQLEQQQQQQTSHQSQRPFSEVGNNSGGSGPIALHNWERERILAANSKMSEIGVADSSRYKNLQWTTDSPRGWKSSSFGASELKRMEERLKEQQKELAELGYAYREERAKRKSLQRELRREQLSREQLTMEALRLNSVIGMLLRQQHATAANPGAGLDLQTLLGVGLYAPPPPTWTANTPSSSSQGAAAGTPYWAPPAHHHGHHPHQPQPNFALLQPQNFAHLLHGGGGNTGPGEYLAPPLLSTSSLNSHPNEQQQHHHYHPNDAHDSMSQADEVKNFRTGDHNMNSFSGSSRPSDASDLERDKNDLISDSSNERTNSLLIEIGRFGASCNGGGAHLLGHHSFSVDNCSALFNNGKSKILADDLTGASQQQLKDDGYATSETNMSTPGPTAANGTGGDRQPGGGPTAVDVRLRDSISTRTL